MSDCTIFMQIHCEHRCIQPFACDHKHSSADEDTKHDHEALLFCAIVHRTPCAAGMVFSARRPSNGIEGSHWHHLRLTICLRVKVCCAEEHGAGDVAVPVIRRHCDHPLTNGLSLQGNMVLVMDLMERGDLYHLLDRRDKQGRQVFSFIHRGRRVAREIALGLCFLHSLRQAPTGRLPLVTPCRRGRGVVDGSTSVKIHKAARQAAGKIKLMHSLWWGSPAWCLPAECVQKEFSSIPRAQEMAELRSGPDSLHSPRSTEWPSHTLLFGTYKVL